MGHSAHAGCWRERVYRGAESFLVQELKFTSPDRLHGARVHLTATKHTDTVMNQSPVNPGLTCFDTPLAYVAEAHGCHAERVKFQSDAPGGGRSQSAGDDAPHQERTWHGRG